MKDLLLATEAVSSPETPKSAAGRKGSWDPPSGGHTPPTSEARAQDAPGAWFRQQADQVQLRPPRPGPPAGKASHLQSLTKRQAQAGLCADPTTSNV